MNKDDNKVKQAAKAEQMKKAASAAKKNGKVKKYRVKKTLGFEKRNYNIDGENILLIAGEEIPIELVKAFSPDVQDIFFEVIQ